MRNGYRLYQGYNRLRDKFVSLLVRGGFAEYGSNTVLAHPVRLGSANRIAIGSGVYIGAGSWLQVVEGDDEASDPRGTVIQIGDDVRISGLCVLSGARSIVIEDGALLARNVYVADHGHAFEADDTAIHRQGIDRIDPVRIGAGAWLGQNVVLLPGASVGRQSIIGANSVVRGTIPDRSIAMGAPARVVRSLDDE